MRAKLRRRWIFVALCAFILSSSAAFASPWAGGSGVTSATAAKKKCKKSHKKKCKPTKPVATQPAAPPVVAQPAAPPSIAPSMLSVAKAGTGTGAVTSSPGGINCGATCSETYINGTVVSLSAVSDPGAVFTGWTGACTGTGACNVTMDAARSVTATFTITQRTLDVSVSTVGSGSVTSSPAGIDCGADCSEAYDYGQSVALTPTPGSGRTFTGWSGDCTGTGACNVTMDAARSVTATFVVTQHALSVTKIGTGSGVVESNPNGISCGATCSASYSEGQLVSLTATQTAGSTFAGWNGACTGTGACSVTMDAARSVTATFTRIQYTLTVAKGGDGSVTSSPSGIDCPGDCSEAYDSGTMVALTPSPAPGWVFVRWSGACTGVDPCNVTMDGARSVTADFDPILSVTRNGSGLGTVTSNPSGISCGTTCTAGYEEGSMVFLSAIADESSTFDGWSGACSGVGSCGLTMNFPTSLTATFTQKRFTLYVSTTGDGSVSNSPAGIVSDCGAFSCAQYGYGTEVTLTPNPNAGRTFISWGGDCSGSGACTVTIDANKSVTATFSTS